MLIGLLYPPSIFRLSRIELKEKMLIEKYIEVRTQTERLCAPLHKEDYIPQAVNYASPPKWHLAHTAWFFEDMILKDYLPGYAVYDARFSKLFNSYYQSIGVPAARSDRGIITRPTVEEVYTYRKHVDDHMKVLLNSDISENVKEFVILGLNHEQQHQELLITDLKYVFGLNTTWPVYDKNCNYLASESGDSGSTTIPEGIYEIGYSGDNFCFDNELNRHKVYLQSYEISNSLVTNGEYMAFINDGGYLTFSPWLGEGWEWIQSEKIRHPLYWHMVDGTWHTYTLAGLIPIDLDSPMSHISYYEAEAFARWKGARLPTEFEWEVAADKFSWGARWEWTSSAYASYPNFRIREGALGEYNAKFMVNQMVLRGASTVTAIGHSRATYRNFFHPQLRWQFSGIRLAK